MNNPAEQRRTQQFRIYDLTNKCRDATYQAIATCIYWQINTPGEIHASPRFGIVNVESVFWLDGTVSLPTITRTLDSSRQRQSVWSPGIKYDGVFFDPTFDVTYTQGTIDHTVSCSDVAGLLDSGNPEGRDLPFALRIFNDNRLVFASRSTGLTGPGADRDGDQVNNDDSDDDYLLRGHVLIERELLSGQMVQITTIDFGPWSWDFDGDRTIDWFHDIDPGSQISIEKAVGEPVFEELIATKLAVTRVGQTGVTATEIRDALRDYEGPSGVFEQHGVYPMRVWVDRTLRGGGQTSGSILQFKIHARYTWIERWPADEFIGSHTGTSSNPRGRNGPGDWTEISTCRPAAGSLCDPKHEHRVRYNVSSWKGSPKTVQRSEQYPHTTTTTVPCEKPKLGEKPPTPPCYSSVTVQKTRWYTHYFVSECISLYYIPSSETGDARCNYAPTSEYRHLYLAYYTCRANNGLNPDVVSHRWYDPPLGITADRSRPHNPPDASGSCANQLPMELRQPVHQYSSTGS